MADLKLKVDKRKLYGRKIKKLRQEGILPANIYGKKLKSQAIKVDLKDFLAIYKEAGETGIVKLNLAKETKTRPVLIHNLQKDPVTDQPLHADFHQVDLKTKVQVSIPIELKGEAPAVGKGGVLIQLINEVEVESLPMDLPDKFELDISKIEEVGQGISVKELKIDEKKVKILIDNKDQLVVKVEEPKEEKEEAPAEESATADEGEEGEEKKPEEGKEGEEKTEEKKVKEGEEGKRPEKGKEVKAPEKAKSEAKKEEKAPQKKK